MDSLRTAAAEVGRLTTPARDLEVMACALESRGHPESAASRRAGLKQDHLAILKHPALEQLFVALDQWPIAFRSSQVGSSSAVLNKLIVKPLVKNVDTLDIALDDDQFDRHELRILVKRTRYLTEAFPELSPLTAKAAKSLKTDQSELGSWHDHFQWCLKAKVEPNLAPLEGL
ncbi:CHAD domain-containing protein [Pseudomonas huanghezhanensis]|uniref:CHAD domain-containing protein n=1 Tax=Pseudomonas huanghezhanensis TaxID=3002903 RepID=UPI002286781A|nr:CHAD domain-containing protein [Pseudomonas sp. BSw22131]